MVKEHDITKVSHCNECPNSCAYDSACDNGQLLNWYCKENGTKRILKMAITKNTLIRIPTWCPMHLNENASNGDNKHKMTYAEKVRAWEKFGFIEWDDIKVDTIYHVPPILNEKRKDILITSKTSYSFTYKTIFEDKTVSSYITYGYKSNIWWKFLTEPQLINVEIVKKS